MQASGKGGSSSTPVSDDWFPRPEKGTDALSYVRRMRLSPFHPFHHVRRRGPPMIGPQHAREEAILPEVARPPAARVVILRVPPMNAPQQNRQRILALPDGHQVHVIAHQAPAQQARARIGQVSRSMRRYAERSWSKENVSQRFTPLCVT